MSIFVISTAVFVIAANPADNEVLLSDDIDWEKEDAIVSGLTSLAICGIEDPVRPEVSYETSLTNINIYRSIGNSIFE